MESSKRYEEFIDWIIADDEAKDYDESLPFGGLQENAPDDVKAAYKEYCDEQEILDSKGIKCKQYNL